MEVVFKIESRDTFEKVSQDILGSLFYSSQAPHTSLVADGIYDKAKHEMRTLITECNFNLHQVVQLFHDKGWDREKVDYFVGLLEQNQSELLVAALNYYQSNYGETVTNFDWLLKLVLGTSELKTLKYPLVQLILSTVNKNGDSNKLMYDVNKDMLIKLINVLENIEIS